jgi:YfiH family protein
MRSSDWVLHRNDDMGWLSFPPLEESAFLLHGFFIKNRGFPSKVMSEKIERFLHKLSSRERKLVSLSQKHGDECVVLISTDNLRRDQPGDAVFTNRDDVFISVAVADCLPIFLWHAKKRVVGLVHAGWRGTLLGVAQRSIKRAEQRFGCSPRDFLVLFGPCIRSCCYQVSADVGILFESESVTPGENGAFMLDLIEANMKQLRASGVEENKMFVADACTFCNTDMFHSYRREKERSGKMFAFMGLR